MIFHTVKTMFNYILSWFYKSEDSDTFMDSDGVHHTQLNGSTISIDFEPTEAESDFVALTITYAVDGTEVYGMAQKKLIDLVSGWGDTWCAEFIASANLAFMSTYHGRIADIPMDEYLRSYDEITFTSTLPTSEMDIQLSETLPCVIDGKMRANNPAYTRKKFIKKCVDNRVNTVVFNLTPEQ